MNKYEIINETNEEIKELTEINNVVEFALKYQKKALKKLLKKLIYAKINRLKNSHPIVRGVFVFP